MGAGQTQLQLKGRLKQYQHSSSSDPGSHPWASPAPWSFKQGCGGSRMLPLQSKGLSHDATISLHPWKTRGPIRGWLMQHRGAGGVGVILLSPALDAFSLLRQRRGFAP